MMHGAVGLIVTLALGLLWGPLVAHAQPPAKVSRIGLIRAGPLPSSSLEALRQELRELGYGEGQTMIIEYRWVEPEGLSKAVAELVHLIPSGWGDSMIPLKVAPYRPLILHS
jgi:hypothetical protein